MTCRSNHCKQCSNWIMDIDDHFVGWCKHHNEWRGQFEGFDRLTGECAGFAARLAPPAMMETNTKQYKVKRAKVNQGANKNVIEANRELLLKWHAEGKSCYAMAKDIGISERSSGCVSRWFREQGLQLKPQKHGYAVGGAR